MQDYNEFLASKVAVAKPLGVPIDNAQISERLKPHQRDIVRWMVTGGRRACFAAFGLGKSVIQLEAVRLTLLQSGGRGLIVCPLGVRAEFIRDSQEILGWETPPKFIRTMAETDTEGIYITNYETVRDGKLDTSGFSVVSLDEAAVLRGFGGTKTFREFMRTLAGDDRSGDKTGQRHVRTEGVKYRFVATATPSPNEYIELLAYAAYLDVMDVSAAKTRFFKRDSTKADKLTIHPHKVDEFWQWVSSWAVFVQKPSDISPSYSDDGYDMPPLDVRWHEIPVDHTAGAGVRRDGQARMFKDAAIGVQDSAREKRESLPDRMAKLLEIMAEEPFEHRVIWHDLEAERAAIERALPLCATVYGTQNLDDREHIVAEFADGQIATLAAKPVMLGSGCNLQRHCARAVFLGIGFKFNDFIQAVHRIRRFLQDRPVRIDLIYTESESEIRKTLERKWQQHEVMVQKMGDIIRTKGLANIGAPEALHRSMNTDRQEITGPNFRIINNDSIEETRTMEPDSVDLIVTSIPFSTQYEYSPSYRDLGHTDNSPHFFAHLGYLTAELFRILKPGRVAAIHVKDRITPGGINGFGFQTVDPFSDQTVAHMREHGFAFLARKTVVTDVVRENNQTYRLGWTEQCKDGSRMGAGMPEYVLLFRKPPTDRTNGYADDPVVKDKAKYSRSRWQIDAHGYMRSNGNRPLTVEDLEGMSHRDIFRAFRRESLTQVYDFEHHVELGEAIDRKGMLPTTFMLLQPQSWHPDVWTDIARMRTLNMNQAAGGRQMHLCPMQFDIADRLIVQFSEEGETVFDPFAGIGTVPYCAIRLGRVGLGCELSADYFADSAIYCTAASKEADIPTLFDLSEFNSVEAEVPA